MDYNIASIRMAQFKDPTMALILSVVVGSLGVDRFYVGIFIIQDATKRKNLEQF